MFTAEEIGEFKRDGYIVKRGLLDPPLMHRAIERVWQELPDSFELDRPESWTGVVTDSCQSRSVAERRGHLKFRECLRKEALLFALVPSNEKDR